MKVLIIGSGGREHAILDRIRRSPVVKKIYTAPGNAGMADYSECVSIPPENIEMLLAFAIKNKIDLTVVGPELPLTLGIVDAFRSEGLAIFGPDKSASILEGSKIFTKEFCLRHDIPTAPFEVFEELRHAKEWIARRDVFPVVVKADGIAAGKGVVIAKSREEAEKAVTDMMLYERFGNAGRRVLIEDFISGEEASYIVMTDGSSFVAFPPAQDHKRIFDHDEGPNTGGMGAYAPAPLVTRELAAKIDAEIIQPTLKGMRAEDRSYLGFLFAGIMVSGGQPYLIEYNCRLGDPETEVILPLLESDLVELMQQTLAGCLNPSGVRFADKYCAGVVLASGGYPESYKKGFEIEGIGTIDDPEVCVFHAGTSRRGENWITDGGRVLVISAKASDLAGAVAKSYENVAKIKWDGMHYRKDIGAKGLRRTE